MKNPPSAEQALMFDGYVKKWQEKLSLCDWRIERGSLPCKKAMATIEFNDPARLAVYRLGDFGAETITEESLERTALHELLHVVLHDLMMTTTDCSSSPEQIEAAEHRVINLLERLLFSR